MNCFMLKEPAGLKVAVLYICVTRGNRMDAYSQRFCQTYKDNDAEWPHKLVVLCNGGELPPNHRKFFDGVNCEFFNRPNDGGKDMSAYQQYAAERDSDFLVCFGESIQIRGPGWLRRLVEARLKYGPGMYGCFSSHMVRAHLNTTAFAIDAEFLRRHPLITNQAMRYEAEHGPGCLWQRVFRGGGAAMLVTWSGEYGPGHWRDGRGIMHDSQQEDCIVWSHHCEEWSVANEPTRTLWTTQSNQPFRL